MKKQKLSLYHPMFAVMREELDGKITQAFEAMEFSKIGDATITLKLSLSVQEVEALAEDGRLRLAKVPVIAYKIQNAVKAVYAEGGIVDTGRMEIVRDSDGGYSFKPIRDGQMRIEDMEGVDGIDAEELPEFDGIGDMSDAG